MIVAIAAIAVFLFYVLCVPVKFALIMRAPASPGFGLGAAAFAGSAARRQALRRAYGEKKRLPWRRSALKLERNAALPAALRAGWYLMRHTKLEQLQAGGKLACGDAARTALACGFLRALEGALQSAAPGAVCLRPEPDFSSVQSALHVNCMLSVSAGHIIMAALIGARHYILRRVSLGKASH